MLFSFWFDKFKLSNGAVALLLLTFISILPRLVTLPREIRSLLCADERDFFHDVPFANGARLTARRTTSRHCGKTNSSVVESLHPVVTGAQH